MKNTKWGFSPSLQNAELQQARQTAVGRKELARLYTEGQRAKAVGNYDLAETLYQRAASFDGQNEGLKKELTDLDRLKKGEEQRFVLAAFRSQNPVAVNFRDAKLKDALQVVCEPYNLNFVFDKNADNLDVSVSAKNVNFEQAFNMVLQAANAGYKVLGPNSIFIYEDTPDKKKQYADLYFKTFHLSTLKAERMAEILKSSMEIKTLVANNDLGTIQVRDTRDTLDVVEKLIAANDRKPAEIMLNVEILEINRNKSDQLGIDWGSQISVTPQGVTADAAAVASGATSAVASSAAGVTLQALAEGSPLLKQSTVTLPTVTLNYLKNVVDARTLSNPRVRTVDGQAAKIHVGDRVPLQIGVHPGRDRAKPHDLRISRHRHRARRDPEISPRQFDLRRPQCRGEFAGPEPRHDGGAGLRHRHAQRAHHHDLARERNGGAGRAYLRERAAQPDRASLGRSQRRFGASVLEPRRYRAADRADFDRHALSRALAIAAEAQQHRLLQRHGEGLFDPGELRLPEQNAGRQTAATISCLRPTTRSRWTKPPARALRQGGWQTTGYAR